MTENNHNVPNIMPDALIQPITDMELINAKLKRTGELNKNAEDKTFSSKNKEVKL